MQQATLKEDDLYYTDAPVGDILRHAREHYKQTLLDVEKALHIRSSQIEAIEKSEYEKLPGRVYAVGFIRAYAEYLGLDPERIVGMYKSQTTGATHRPVLQFPVIASDSQLPSKKLIFICALIIVGIFSIWTSISHNGKNAAASPEIKPPAAISEPIAQTALNPELNPELDLALSPDLNPATLNGEAPALTDTPAETQVPVAPVDHPIILTMTQDSWVEIRDENNKTLISTVLKKGSQYKLKDNKALTISIGNAGGVEASWGEEVFGVFGKKGEVIRKFPLTSTSLKETYGSPEQNTLNQSLAN